MLFAVVPTHLKGKRRFKEDMAGAEQFTGLLTVDQMPSNSAGRPLLVANLKDHEDRYGRCVIPPLFDVQIAKLTRRGMYLVGYQIEVEDGKAIEFAQGWWAKFIQPTSG
jgi:hypothetical protein